MQGSFNFHRDVLDHKTMDLPTRPKASSKTTPPNGNATRESSFQLSLPLRIMAGDKRKALEQAGPKKTKRPTLASRTPIEQSLAGTYHEETVTSEAGSSNSPQSMAQQAPKIRIPKETWNSCAPESLTAGGQQGTESEDEGPAHHKRAVPSEAGRSSTRTTRQKRLPKLRIPKESWNSDEVESLVPAGTEDMECENGGPSSEMAQQLAQPPVSHPIKVGGWDGLIPDAEFRVKPMAKTLDFLHSEGEETEGEVDSSLLNYRELRKRLRKQRQREEEQRKRQGKVDQSQHRQDQRQEGHCQSHEEMDEA